MISRDIIVVGASAGGFDALQRLVSGFPPNFPAAVFVTMHLFERSEGVLPELLRRAGPLPVEHPWDETEIQAGHIYVAPPDYHLVLTSGQIHLSHGPRENLQRPCINTMFRSAAAAFGERVTGVVLTGLLDDGAAGLWEIQQRGGATVVQDPDEAEFRSMPQNAIQGVSVQYILRLEEIAPLLVRLSMGDNNQARSTGLSTQNEEAALQACPECGGVMRLYRLGKLREYRCHVGHRMGLKTIISEKSKVVERSVWTALSQCEELSGLLEQALADADREVASVLQQELAQRQKEQSLLRSMAERTKSALLA